MAQPYHADSSRSKYNRRKNRDGSQSTQIRIILKLNYMNLVTPICRITTSAINLPTKLKLIALCTYNCDVLILANILVGACFVNAYKQYL